jgi:hypothetical protein
VVKCLSGAGVFQEMKGTKQRGSGRGHAWKHPEGSITTVLLCRSLSAWKHVGYLQQQQCNEVINRHCNVFESTVVNSYPRTGVHVFFMWFRRSKRKDACCWDRGHSKLSVYSWFNRLISNVTCQLQDFCSTELCTCNWKKYILMSLYWTSILDYKHFQL